MWIRKIVLSLTDDAGEVLWEVSDAKMDFVYQGTGGGDAADTCTVDILNLSHENLRTLVDLSGLDTTRVHLKAGYVDEVEEGGDLPTVLYGVIINVSGRREKPQHTTTLYMVPLAARRLRSQIVSVEYRGPSSYREFIEFLSAVAQLKGQPTDWDAVEPDIKNAIIRDKSDQLDIFELLRKYTRQSGLMADIHGDAIRIAPAVSNANSLANIINNGTIPHKIQPELMRGVPTIEACAIEIPYTLSPHMRVFDVVEPDKLFGERDKLATEGIAKNGIGAVVFRDPDVYKYMIYEAYQVIELVHSGSNWDDQWNTNIKGVAYASRITDQTKAFQTNDNQGE